MVHSDKSECTIFKGNTYGVIYRFILYYNFQFIGKLRNNRKLGAKADSHLKLLINPD